MKQVNPDFVGFGGGRGNGNNRGNRGNGGNNVGGNNGGGNNGGGQNANNPRNRPQFDAAAFQKMRDEMQKINEMPEVKAEREKQQEMQKSVENESYAMITKALYPRQRATLKKLAGPPFDRSVMGNRPFGGPATGDGGATGNTSPAKDKAAAKPKSEDDDEEASAAAPAKPAAAAKPSATAPRRKSLRELRGGSSDDE